MDYENKKNQQEDVEGKEQIESLEDNEFSPEKPLDEIKNVAKEKGEASLSAASEELEATLTNYSAEVSGEETLVAELEAIQSEAEGEIKTVGAEFGQNLESVKDENTEKTEEKPVETETASAEKPAETEKQSSETQNEKVESLAEQKAKSLEMIRADFGERGKIANEIKKTKDPEKLKQLQEKLADKDKNLEQAKSIYLEAISTEVAERLISFPDSQLAITKEIVMPGLEAMAMERSASIEDGRKKTFLDKMLKTAGKYVPKNEYARTLAVSTAIGLATSIPHIATGGTTILLKTGIKILLAAGGVTIGEKISKFVDKGIEKGQEKNRDKRLNDKFDGSIGTMIKLAEQELKTKNREAKVRKVVKVGLHVILASAALGGAELGLGMGHGLETFATTTKHSFMDIMGDEGAHKAMHEHMHGEHEGAHESSDMKMAA